MLLLLGVDLVIIEGWLVLVEVDVLFVELLMMIFWENYCICMFGCEVVLLWLSCWIGDFGVSYVYLCMCFELYFWLVVLVDLCICVECVCDVLFNSVLVNFYCSGGDVMGWYSDDELELGVCLVIVLLSFGEIWCFLLCVCVGDICIYEL